MIVACSGCNKRIKVPEAAAGKRIKCPQCATVLNVPALDATPPTKPAEDLEVPDTAGEDKPRRPSTPPPLPETLEYRDEDFEEVDEDIEETARPRSKRPRDDDEYDEDDEYDTRSRDKRRRDRDDDDRPSRKSRRKKKPPKPISVMAIVSMVLGVCSLLLLVLGVCCGINSNAPEIPVLAAVVSAVGGLTAVILGRLGRTPGNAMFAWTGIICGYIVLVLVLVAIITFGTLLFTARRR